MLGVITHDDVLDAAVEELVEDAHMSAAVSAARALKGSFRQRSNCSLCARNQGRSLWKLRSQRKAPVSCVNP